MGNGVCVQGIHGSRRWASGVERESRRGGEFTISLATFARWLLQALQKICPQARQWCWLEGSWGTGYSGALLAKGMDVWEALVW